VRLIDSGYVLADAGSRNGTFLNDRQVMAPTPLADGDRLRVGDTPIRFSEVPPAAEGPETPASAPVPEAVGPAVSGLFVTPDALEIPPPPEPTTFGALEVEGRRFELLSDEGAIGRDQLSDVSLDDPAVSGTHAQITEHGGALYVRDLGSRNGTFVNRALVSVPHALRDGDVIHVGNTDLTFRSGDAAAPPATSGSAEPVNVAEPSRPAAADAAVGPSEAPVAPRPTSSVAPEPPPAAPAPAPGPPEPAVSDPRAASRPKGFRLVVEAGPLVGLSFRLAGPAVLVGRDPDADVSLSEPTASWRHARMSAHGAAWTITDLGSTNGTQVNGRRLEPERQTPIDPGAEIRFGEITLRFEETD
jgi:ABC transport system ATP-binding/permease protein